MATQSTTQGSSLALPQEAGQSRRVRKRSAAELMGEVARYAVLIVLALSFCLPFYWMVSSALKDDSQVYVVPPIWFPYPLHWNNFPDAWTLRHLNFNLYAYNTVVKYAIPATIGTVLSSALVAYSFSRIQWRGRDTLFAVMLSTLMIPYWVTLVPLFVIFKDLNWINTFLPLVVPAFFGNPFFIFLLRQFFMSLPAELSDAARVDGANELQTMFQIILPLARPALAVVALFKFLDSWNDYLGPLIYVNIDSQWVLAIGVEKLRSALYEVGGMSLAYPYLMAVSTLITLPIFLAFFFAQRMFIEGISVTGIKG
jgi:ABC-type glycerol-3-phosphate transport system permease component